MCVREFDIGEPRVLAERAPASRPSLRPRGVIIVIGARARARATPLPTDDGGGGEEPAATAVEGGRADGSGVRSGEKNIG